MRVVSIPAITAILLAGSAQAATDPSGTWLTGDGRAKVKIERCGPSGANVCGTVVWVKSPLNDQGQPRTDIKNPDPKKRSRPVIGMALMDNLKPDEDGFKGQIYNADEGKFYDVTLARESASELSVSGCLLRILCGSQTWTKAPDEVAQAAPKPAKAAAPKAAPAEKAAQP